MVGGRGKFTHSPEKLLWSMWSKILWDNRKTTLKGAIYGKKNLMWRHCDVSMTSSPKNGVGRDRKLGKSRKNTENQDEIVWWWLTSQFLYFHEFFQKKIVSLTFHTNKASKSVKKKSQFPITADNQPLFRKNRWLWSKNFRKHVKLNFVSLKIFPECG